MNAAIAADTTMPMTLIHPHRVSLPLSLGCRRADPEQGGDENSETFEPVERTERGEFVHAAPVA